MDGFKKLLARGVPLCKITPYDAGTVCAAIIIRPDRIHLIPEEYRLGPTPTEWEPGTYFQVRVAVNMKGMPLLLRAMRSIEAVVANETGCQRIGDMIAAEYPCRVVKA